MVIGNPRQGRIEPGGYGAEVRNGCGKQCNHEVAAAQSIDSPDLVFEIPDGFFGGQVHVVEAAGEEEERRLRVEFDGVGAHPGSEVVHLVAHAQAQQRASEPFARIAAGFASADGEVEAFAAGGRVIGRHERKAQALGQIGDGRGPIAVKIPLADVGVAVAEDI